MAEFNTTQITNFSNAYDTNYFFVCERFGTTLYWVKEFDLPEISAQNGDEIIYEEYAINTEPTVFSYGDLSIQFYIDEKHEVYDDLYDWLLSSIPGDDYESSKENARLCILDNNRKSIVRYYEFEGLKPFNIGSLSYRNTQSIELTLPTLFNIDKMTPKSV